MSRQPITEMLEKYACDTALRLHMPGHGGKSAEKLGEIFPYDVTELEKTDDLYRASGAIAEAEELAAKSFFAGKTLFSAGGATLALQGAIAAALSYAGRDARVICDRSCHRSVANAFALLGIDPEWTLGLPSEEKLKKCDIFIFTSCDYYGRIVDLGRYASVCKKSCCIAIADNSHGSHLAYWRGGGLHPQKHGIDFTVDSLHKTLPVLTGGAMLHISKGFLKKHPDAADRAVAKMSVFGSTSPSFPILASLDRARAILDDDTEKGTSRTLEGTAHLVGALVKEFSDSFFKFPGKKNSDPFRLVALCEDGRALYDHLASKGIVCEFFDRHSVIMILPFGFSENDYNLLSSALHSYPGASLASEEPPLPPHLPEKAMTVREALMSESVEIPLGDAEGYIAHEQYSVYPPGIPQIVAGEIFDREVIEALTGSVKTVRVIAR